MTTDDSKARRGPEARTYWRLLAIGLDPEHAGPELYGLVYEGATDAPLMVGDRIALFTDRGRARELLAAHGARAADVVDVDGPFFVCDVAQTLHLLSAGGRDVRGAVVKTVNVLLDLVAATGVAMDGRRRAALGAIADYCTTHDDVTRYLEEDGDYASRELVDAVLWCVGVVAVSARIV